MASPCLPTGRRPSDQCHCREWRYNKRNVSTLGRHKLSSLEDFPVKVGNCILVRNSQTFYDLLRTPSGRGGGRISVNFLQYRVSDGATCTRNIKRGLVSSFLRLAACSHVAASTDGGADRLMRTEKYDREGPPPAILASQSFRIDIHSNKNPTRFNKKATCIRVAVVVNLQQTNSSKIQRSRCAQR